MMASLRTFVFRLRALFGSRTLDRQLDQEIDAHLELAVADHIARGVAPDEARHRALREFGSVLRAKEVHRETRSFRALDALVQDIRYALRSYRRTPVFTLVALATLVLAIGANTAVFSLLNALVLRDLPVREPESLVQVSTLAPPSFAFESGLSFPIIKQGLLPVGIGLTIGLAAALAVTPLLKSQFCRALCHQ
jgi:hypothetical protein